MPRRPPLPPSALPSKPSPAELTFRSATEEDLDRLVDIHAGAFPDARGAESRRRNFAQNPLGHLTQVRVACAGDTLVAHAFLFAFEACFGGVPVRAGGVASLGVAAEARGRGVAAALLADLHAQSDARGDAITLLYPFRQGFYARHGYAAVSPLRRLVFHPAAIPAAWARASRLTVRAAGGRDRAAITQAFQRGAARTSGRITRPENLWTRLFADERRVWIAAEDGARFAGYVAWSLTQADAHGPTRLVVHELLADDDHARRTLLGAIAAQRDQVGEVEIDVDAADPLDRALTDGDRGRNGNGGTEHPLGVLTAGPMVRIASARRALEARGYVAPGVVDLAVEGEGRLRVAASEDGRATVSAAPAHGPALTLDRATLAAILYGALAPRDAARLGALEADSDAVLARADTLFALPSFHAVDSF